MLLGRRSGMEGPGDIADIASQDPQSYTPLRDILSIKIHLSSYF
jgi:hypothetical protein